MGKRKVAQASEAGDAEQKDSAEAGSNEEDQSMEVQPIGEVIKKTGRGRSERKFYEAFELDGVRYNLEDSVLITPEEKSQKPYVAIIKEIKQSKDGSLAVTGQWFYRPEEADRKGGGSWVADDARELFYSFHRDEVPAESVMHKCVVHFIPSHKKSPTRAKHPGFIVRKVYDTVEKKLWNLTDKDYEDSKQKEIDLLVQKTRQALGDLPDVEPDQVVAETEKIEKAEKVEKTEKVEKAPRKTLRRKYAPKEDISIPVNDGVTEPSAAGRAETPGAGAETPKAETPGAGKALTDIQGASVSELLRQGGALVGNKARDRWQEKLLHSVRSLFEPKQGAQPASGSEGGSESSVEKQGEFSPDAAVAAISALEKAAYEAIGDIHKYNLKMRSLEYNLKNGHVLARRLLAKELEPSTVVNMPPNELKDGMTAVEKSAQEPEQPQTVQMADVSCTLCGERQVGVKDIIHAMNGDRYQLECLKCGNSWYSARDSISSLTMETVSPSPRVESAPWVTSKFEEKEVAAHLENDTEHKEQPPAPNENEKNEKEQPSAPNVNEKNETEQPSAPHENEKNETEQPSAPHENEKNEKEQPSAAHENEMNEKEQPSAPNEKKPAAETTEIDDKEQPSGAMENQKENENEIEQKEGTQDVQMTDIQDEQAATDADGPVQARSEDSKGDAAKGALKDEAAPAESGEVQDMVIEPPSTSDRT